MVEWYGLEECEISLPEILSQSCPVLHGGCSVMKHPLANNIKCKLFCINVLIWREVQLPAWH